MSGAWNGDERALLPPGFAWALAGVYAAVAAALIGQLPLRPLHKIVYRPAPERPAAVIRRIWLDPAGTVRFEGAPVGLAELRRAADLAMVGEPEPVFLVHVHPEARYEDLVELMAVLRRAGVADMRLPHPLPYDDSIASSARSSSR